MSNSIFTVRYAPFWATLFVAAFALFSASSVCADAPPEPTAVAAPVALTLPSTPPAGAIVLFSGKQKELTDLWLKRRSTDPAGWKAESGVASPADKTDIVTRQEFGDCFLHVEFKCPVEGGGNAGIGLQGRYEVQIFNSFGAEPEPHGAGALYDQKAARINASKKPGEWQSYDIVFRAPRFNDKNEVTEQPRVTVWQNGLLVQNNEAFTGMTGIQYEVYKDQTKTGPLVLQGDHDAVQYRNIWILPL